MEMFQFGKFTSKTVTHNFCGFRDLEHSEKPLWTVKGHESITNCVDGCGGLGIGKGAPEIVSGGRDGLYVFQEKKL